MFLWRFVVGRPTGRVVDDTDRGDSRRVAVAKPPTRRKRNTENNHSIQHNRNSKDSKMSMLLDHHHSQQHRPVVVVVVALVHVASEAHTADVRDCEWPRSYDSGLPSDSWCNAGDRMLEGS